MSESKNNIIFINENIKDKNSVLEFLSKVALDNGYTNNKDSVLEAYTNRENQISTGLEDEFAIPHAKSKAISKPGLIFIKLSEGIEWETFDNKKVKYIISFLIPESGGSDYLEKLSILAGNLADTETRKKIKNCKTESEVNEVLNSFFMTKEKEVKKNKKKSDKYILGISSCAAGLAHTYMAKKAIEDACEKLGYNYKVEAHGSLGVENRITEEELKNALFLIKAVDVEVDEENRFNNLFKYQCSTNDFIKNKEKELEKAISKYEKVKNNFTEKEEVEFNTKNIDSSESNKKDNIAKRFGRDILKHMMSGIGYCIPLLIGAGLMIGISQLLALISVENSVENFSSLFPGTLDSKDWVQDVKGWNGFIWTLYFFGMNIGLGYLFLTLLGGFIGYSINGKAGLAPGLIAGFVCIMRNTGFIGVILTSLTVGYIIKFVIAFMTPKGKLRPLGSVLFVPLIGFFAAISMGWWVYGFPLEWLNVALQDGLKKLAENQTQLVLLCVLIAGMMAFDLGGPVNKSAWAVYTFLWTDTSNSDVVRFVPNAAGNIAIAVPALGIAIATWIVPRYFTLDDKVKANTSFITGLFGISEGAIPFLIKYPLRSICINVTGAILAVIPFVVTKNTMTVGAGAIYGWVFTSNPWLYIVCIMLGAVWVGCWQALFQKIHFHKKTNTKFALYYSKNDFKNNFISIGNLFVKKENKKPLLEDKFKIFINDNNINIEKIENY
ncbi:PTS system 2-O-a-mannosyl-D-glycerate specific transporter IIABC component [Spiroplasma chinense]|uniref:PTS system 2-O-a-mannosyl-D-glycerate specific transporter IIABC component n=1 Tax=Spiroplasma chinense TaxID=216932 RepID=A0A5B9Y7B0_9MOLU|nr:fructose-specific PTS transporter subunit EIIC [Spiroplasma chinense]QEH61992.1 PTS system 2-O-a-mannosyl-D-glycerate specific transporter IIABC component [Spiroplasma chinense]